MCSPGTQNCISIPFVVAIATFSFVGIARERERERERDEQRQNRQIWACGQLGRIPAPAELHGGDEGGHGLQAGVGTLH